MESTEILLTILFSLLSAALTCAIWYYGNQSGRFLRACDSIEQDKSSNKNELTGNTARLKEVDNKLETAACEETSNATNTTVSRNGEKEMTMKERFYLFLDKGFCPELEEGQEDPLHQYFGGKKKSADAKDVNIAKLLCPFDVESHSEESVDSDDSVEQGDELRRASQNNASSLEKLIKLAKSNGGKCPFDFGKSATIKDEDECPFNFGLAKDADSEDEADVPPGHRGDANCPMKHGRDIAEPMSAQPDVTSGENESASAHMAVKKTCRTIESTLSADELRQETKMQEEQLAAVVKLLAAQGDSLSSADPSELKSQLQMYM